MWTKNFSTTHSQRLEWSYQLQKLCVILKLENLAALALLALIASKLQTGQLKAWMDRFETKHREKPHYSCSNSLSSIFVTGPFQWLMRTKKIRNQSAMAVKQVKLYTSFPWSSAFSTERLLAASNPSSRQQPHTMFSAGPSPGRNCSATHRVFILS